MKADVLQRLKKKYFNLSKSQKKLADYILNNYDKVVFMTAKKISENVGVSESTVVRFANALDYDGFPDLIKALQETVKTKLTTLQRFELTKQSASNQGDQLYKQVMMNDIENIKSSIQMLDQETIENISREIMNSRKIYILGLRSSSFLADYMEFYLNYILEDIFIKKINCHNVFDSLVNIGEDDLLITIAFPRYSQATLDAMNYAKKNDIKVIGITDSKFSPLVEYCKYSISADLNLDTFIDSLVAPLSLINALIMTLSINEKNNVEHKFNKLEKIWDEYGIYNRK